MSFAPGWRGTNTIMQENEQMINRGTAVMPNNNVMGDFRIIIDAIGGHGQDRDKKNGEIVDFSKDGDSSPEAIAKRFVDELKQKGVNVEKAVVVHWPLDNYGGQTQNGRTSQIVDDLLTGKRTGSF